MCSNSTEIFDLILSFTSSLDSYEDDDMSAEDQDLTNSVYLKELQSLGPNVIFMRDSVGNTVLHLCVVHCLEDMYRHVYKTAETILKREIKLLYTREIVPDRRPAATYELKDLSRLKEHGICLGYNIEPKVLKRPQQDKLEEWVNYEAKMKVEERLVQALNMDLHSPLTLAAAQMYKEDIPEIMTQKVGLFTISYNLNILS